MKKTPKSRTEAILMDTKKNTSRHLVSEEKLQMDMVTAFSDKFPEKRGRLFATFQNPTPEQHGLWLSKGMVKGVADLIYIDNNCHIVGIEVKDPEKRHHKKTVIDQANWLLNCCHCGYFCTSVEMFWEIINGGKGIDPKKVLKFVEKVSTIQFKRLSL
jgi:hypothetical protein